MIPAAELEYWATIGKTVSVQALLRRGVDVNAKGVDGYTAMHGAAENGHVDVLQLLIASGAMVNPQLTSGHTPLDLADLCRQEKASAFLRQHGGQNAVPPGTPVAFTDLPGD